MNNKKGQVTIFIIIAVVLVAAIVAAFLFLPKVGILVRQELNPADFVKKCAADAVNEALPMINKQGGYLDPGNFYLYKGEKLGYLCYTNQYYKTCTVQEPMLKQLVERQITEYALPKIKACTQQLKQNLLSQGYNVQMGEANIAPELELGKINIKVTVPITTTRDEAVTKYNEFQESIDSPEYVLVMIAKTLVDYETSWGDGDTAALMLYFPDTKIEKYEQDEGTTVYILTDRESKTTFKFASRSLAWPPGYEADEEIR